MKTEKFRPHPLMMYYFIKPFLFILVIPLVKGIIEYIIKRSVTGVLLWELILLGALLALSFIRLLSFEITVDKVGITVNRGVLFKTRAHIGKTEISSISVRRNLFDFAFGSVSFNINTEAGKRGEADFVFKLSETRAKRLYSLLYDDKNALAFHFSPVKVAAMAAATSSSMTGLILGVPVINQAGKMLGVSLSEVLLGEINSLSRKVNTYTPPIVNAITIIALLAYLFAFLVSFSKNIGFKLNSTNEKLEIRSGLLVKKKAVFKKKSINNLRVEQTPLMRLMRTYSMCASVAGYSADKSERGTLIPSSTRKEIKLFLNAYFPFLVPEGTNLKAPRSYKNGRRFLFVPAFLASAIVVAAIIEGILFPEFLNLVLFLNSALLLIVVYYGNLCLKDYRTARISFGETVFASSSHILSRREIYCSKERIGIIKLTETPADRRYSTCKLKITVRSEDADSIRVKNLDRASVKECIEKCYNISGII